MSLAHAHNAEARGVVVVIDAAALCAGVDIAMPCGLISIELESNALQHAFGDGRSGRIVGTLAADPAGARRQWRLSVADDGIGLPPRSQSEGRPT